MVWWDEALEVTHSTLKLDAAPFQEGVQAGNGACIHLPWRIKVLIQVIRDDAKRFPRGKGIWH